MSHIHIFAPPTLDKAVTTTTCPDCKRRTRMLQFFQEWFGWHSTCILCGRQWDDGEWIALEFRRGVRQDNIARAKERFRRTRAALKETE